MKAAIVGIAGPILSAEERALFETLPPAGVILFGRNVQHPAQLLALTQSLRQVLPAVAVVAVDQEGGRVARLRPPHWRAHPTAGAIGTLHRQDPAAGRRAAFLTGALIGLDCGAAGFDLVCAPVLDLQVHGASDVVGDRSFGSRPADVAALGLAMADGLMAAGTIPVGKHAPGHGPATVDSHHALPEVAADVDLADGIGVFAACAGLPWLMTAHLLYHAFDSERPGTLSAAVIGAVIRERIGFRGVLVSDDLAMRALQGVGSAPGALAAAAVASGCDLAMHCTGVLADSQDVLQAVPAADEGRLSVARALVLSRRTALDEAALVAERDRLIRW